MVNSSFHTENCWTYLGKQPISQEPYLWRLSALDWYLSAGLTMGASRVPILARSAVRIFLLSCGRRTVYVLARAVAEKHRAAVAS